MPAGQWRMEALGQTSFKFGTDSNNAHVQPGGAYHYHGMPEGFVAARGGHAGTMTLFGWAADGFPIYARYGYSVAADAWSAIKLVKGRAVSNLKCNTHRVRCAHDPDDPVPPASARGPDDNGEHEAAGTQRSGHGPGA